MIARIIAICALLAAQCDHPPPLESAIFLSAVANGHDEPTPYLIDNSTIVRIECGIWMGTGVYVGNGMIATARHVVSHGGDCTADGEPVTVIKGSLSTALDFALLSGTKAEFRQLIDCSGFHEGQMLLATGYAEGGPRTVTQRLIASSSVSSEKGFAGLTILRGSITQGMSGGPINDLYTGALVGINNANAGDGVTSVLSLPLSKTSLCKA